METVISKSKFKPKALSYFRMVEETGKPLILTDRGKAVLKIIPYSDEPKDVLKTLRNSVIRYDRATEPVGQDAWEALK